MDPVMQVLMAKVLVTTLLLFVGLTVQDMMAERSRARTGNPF